MPYKTSSRGVAFIARWESEKLQEYRDRAGVRTIGVGHAERQGEAYPNGLTHEQALSLLATDISGAEHAVNSYVRLPLTQNEFDALVSFTFNCGSGALQRSSLLALLNRDVERSEVAQAFLLWDKRKDPATGALVKDAGLLNRRHAEISVFLTPDADDDNPY